ncbi:CDP-alcohol phosphatidyltransferase family protein [Natronosporangium hydrolyticum]|uniref:CDP-alcohol phosphatidyltransferase family protein n=1 Tax=Natronosporangium hydrolyticum TaxID=2811111 RepID=A0A895YG01_9ACTN|nr:CDP-alcohol phosphatidyltransferase family protein [Natronosporangium hydrolyticum]QSB12598.1 CDP-alcohol phosphatidyltransferase family protein [Natronosporangium hydrolyticum]
MPAARRGGSVTAVDRTDRLLTIPNVISVLRLLGVPLFLYLLLVAERDVAALVVLIVGGGTDWLDGWVARRLGQVSRFGAMLDPVADRLYILATLGAFTWREIIPWQFTVALLLRELMLTVGLALLRRAGYGPVPVHYLGKTATFLLLAAFPVLLLAVAVPGSAAWADPVGWALAWWGLGLYWVAGVFYVGQMVSLLRRGSVRT